MATVNELKFPEVSASSRAQAHQGPRHSRFARWVSTINPTHWKYWLVAADMALILTAFVIA